MLRGVHRFVLVLGATVPALAGCGLVDPTGATEITHLDIRLELESEQVATGDSIAADALIINTGMNVARITPTAECFGRLYVKRGDAIQSFRTRPGTCWNTVGAELAIEPRDTLRYTWSLEAVTSGGALISPGDYHVHLELSGHLPHGSELPSGIVRALEVVP